MAVHKQNRLPPEKEWRRQNPINVNAKQEEQIIGILQRNQLRNTAPRRTILQLFLEHDYALSHHNIEELTRHTLDWVTVYRTLKTFVDRGILHESLDDEMKTKYNLCSEECTADHHSDDHLHFKCDECHRTYCLADTEIPAVDVPADYQARNVRVLVSGVCPDCRH